MNNITTNIENMIKEYGCDKKWREDLDYGYKWSSKENMPSLISFIENYIKLPTENILEIAIGYGRLTKLLSEKCTNLYGIDLNQCCVDYCQKEIPSGIFQKTDGLSIPFKNASFDLIVSYASMVHFDKEIIQSYLIHSKNILKNKGICIFHHSANGRNKIGNRSNMTSKYMEQLCKKHSMLLVDQIFWYKINDTYNDCVSVIRNG